MQECVGGFKVQLSGFSLQEAEAVKNHCEGGMSSLVPSHSPNEIQSGLGCAEIANRQCHYTIKND